MSALKNPRHGKKRRVRPEAGFPQYFALAVPDPDMERFSFSDPDDDEDGTCVLHLYSEAYRVHLPNVSVVPKAYDDILEEAGIPDDPEVGWQSIYIWVGQLSGLIKFGYSENHKVRLGQAQSCSGETIIPIGTLDGDTVAERLIHEAMGPYRHHGEWYYPCPEVLKWIDHAMLYGGY